VGIDAVDAYGDHLGVQFLEGRVFDGNCRQLRRSNAGKISWIKKEKNPLSVIIGNPDDSCLTQVERFTGKVRGFFANMHTHVLLRAMISLMPETAFDREQGIPVRT